MNEIALSEQLAFVVSQRRQNEAAVLAQAMQAGINALYRETLIEAYLLEQIPRETILKKLGPEEMEEIEYQCDVLQRDIAWGLKNVCSHTH